MIENLTLENIEISLPGGGSAADARAAVDEKPDTYPEIDRLGKVLPAWGVYARHVKGMTLKLLKLTTTDAPDLRPALVSQNVADLKADDLHVTVSREAECVVRLESSKDAKVTGLKPDSNAKELIKVEAGNATAP